MKTVLLGDRSLDHAQEIEVETQIETNISRRPRKKMYLQT